MPSWRVTKYNPANRNDEGHYLVPDWTAASDIGQTYQGVVLTVESYLATEATYLHAVRIALEAFGGYPCAIDRCEKHPPILRHAELDYPDALLAAYGWADTRKEVSVDEALLLAQLTLREALWVRLRRGRLLVNFGHDYYMSFHLAAGRPERGLTARLASSGLFIERSDEFYAGL